MECPSCGAANADSAAFCSLCLTRFEPQAAVPAQPEAAPYDPFGPATPAAPAPQVAAPGAVEAPAAGAGAAAVVPEPCVPGPSAPGPAAQPAAPVDNAAAAEAYLQSNRRDLGGGPLVVETPTRRLDGDMMKTIAKIGIWPLGFAVLFLVWVFSGGACAMEAGKVIKVAVPPGSQMLGTVEAAKQGVFGSLPEERVKELAIRVYAVPLSAKETVAYYTSGNGAKVLAEAGWTGPNTEEGFAGAPRILLPKAAILGGLRQTEYYVWRRDATVGYRAGESQELMMEIGGSGLAKDVGTKPPAGYSVIRVWTTALAMERFEFPEK